MKTYLEAVEKIIGTALERGTIEKYEFNEGTLISLKEFSEGFSKENILLHDQDYGISCFFPFSEILPGNFRTYSHNGSLDNHWPAFEELANLVMVCDRFIIHDHLEHYAGSAINGYTEGYRFNGVRNWLLALADWKPLILEDIICIIPQYLACSGPFQALWDEGILPEAASEIYYTMFSDGVNYYNDNAAEALLSESSELEDFLTTLSIPVNRGGKFAPYFNNKLAICLYEDMLTSAFDLYREKAFLRGDKFVYSGAGEENSGVARLGYHAVLTSPEYTPAEACRLRLENPDYAAIREYARSSVRKYSENSTFQFNPGSEFDTHLRILMANKNRDILNYLKAANSDDLHIKQVSIGFAGMLARKKAESYLSVPHLAIRNMLNNLPVKAQPPGSTCHYYITLD